MSVKLWRGSLAHAGALTYLVRDTSGDLRCLLCGCRLEDDEGEVAKHPRGQWVVACHHCRALQAVES